MAVFTITIVINIIMEIITVLVIVNDKNKN